MNDLFFALWFVTRVLFAWFAILVIVSWATVIW
jgi:hypothetical protein